MAQGVNFPGLGPEFCEPGHPLHKPTTPSSITDAQVISHLQREIAKLQKKTLSLETEISLLRRQIRNDGRRV
jgi:hypothetical protein